MDSLEILSIVGGSINFGLLIRYVFLWITRKIPVEGNMDWDPKTGRLTKHHRKYRKW